MTTAAARLHLAPLDTSGGRADAVANRLASAIRLGLLVDGERLPPESHFAGQLGVAPATLREALSNLREQGLVHTRRGRGGGTFVRAPTDARAPLLDFGIGELRELGDQRAAIAGSAAFLAAQRALGVELERLGEQVERLAAAKTTSERRRADTQLAVAIAAAGQSNRLTREEARLRAEIGDLMGLDLTDEEHIAMVAGRRRLIEAVRRRGAERARHLAEDHVHAETERLIGLRLAMTEPGAAGADPAAAAGSLDDSIRRLENVIADVAELGAAVRDLMKNKPDGLRRSDFASLRPRILSILQVHEVITSGAGVIMQPGFVLDADLWMEWWSATAEGEKPEPMRVNLAPGAPDFYDYPTMDWFRLPKRTLRPHLSGPNVDHASTNLYAITVSLPLVIDGIFCGVAGVDVLVGTVERRILPQLVAINHPVALTTTAGRVLVSNDASLAPGVRLDLKERSGKPVSAVEPLDSLRLVDLRL